MKGLATLLRLSNTRTEGVRVALAEAVRRRAAMEAECDRHASAMAEESLVQGITGETLRDWSSWHARAGREERGLHRALTQLSAEEDACRDAMRESVADGKRVELALASRIRAERLKEARRRDAAAEDAALRRPARPEQGLA